MGNASGIRADDVQCGQCLYQGRPVSGITGRKQLSIAEGWRDDHGDGEVEIYQSEMKWPAWRS